MYTYVTIISIQIRNFGQVYKFSLYKLHVEFMYIINQLLGFYMTTTYWLFSFFQKGRAKEEIKEEIIKLPGIEIIEVEKDIRGHGHGHGHHGRTKLGEEESLLNLVAEDAEIAALANADLENL